ncbi:MAG: hypothetical protein IJG77_00250 [Aeriscardovia sp.]|nr:hypothetical protein [Aeriscardovia sp.]
MHEIGHSFLGHRQPSVIDEADFFARIAVPPSWTCFTRNPNDMS